VPEGRLRELLEREKRALKKGKSRKLSLRDRSDINQELLLHRTIHDAYMQQQRMIPAGLLEDPVLKQDEVLAPDPVEALHGEDTQFKLEENQ
jgi:hypothetical protein